MKHWGTDGQLGWRPASLNAVSGGVREKSEPDTRMGPEKQVKGDSAPRVSILEASGLPKLGKSGCLNLFSVDMLCSFGDVLFNVFCSVKFLSILIFKKHHCFFFLRLKSMFT